MSKLRRFPGKFFKGLGDDPILDETVGLVEMKSRDEDDRFAHLDALFTPPSGAKGASINNPVDLNEAVQQEARRRDYVVNSIFAPQELREEPSGSQQQLLFVKEHEGALVGLQEIHAQISKGWRVTNAFASGNAFYKALVLLER
jgi:hypothetical protein